MFSIKDYLNRARYLLKNEGAGTFFSKIITSYIFINKEYYLRQHFAGDLKEADFLPARKDFTFKLITDNKTADEWAKQTGCDFRNQILHARQRLNAGAIAFCIFVGKELACVNWLALTPKAKHIINPLPFKVDFDARQACASGAETVPKFRGEGLMAYSWFQRNEYMKRQGIEMLIGTDAVDNKAILTLQTHFPSRIVARARYIHFLFWRYWKEKPVPEGFQPPGLGNSK